MLKLYKTTIIASFIVAIITSTIAVICEFYYFSHSAFIQNYALGISCSLIVVVITTLLQYFYEHKQVFQNYCNSLCHLAFNIGLIYNGFDNGFENKPQETYIEHLYTELNSSFEEFTRCNNDLIWFSPKMKKRQGNVYRYYALLWISFETPKLDSHADAIYSLIHHPKYISLLNAAISFLPNGYSKESLERDKKWATEATTHR